MTKRFLLAEDDEDDVYLFEEAIKSSKVPVEVTAVLSCDNVMDSLSPQSLPQLIILDTSLPGKSPLECIAAIRSKYSSEQVPVLVLSTALSDTLNEKGYDAGFNLMLNKPDTFEGLKTLVEKLYRINWKKHPTLTPKEFYSLAI